MGKRCGKTVDQKPWPACFFRNQAFAEGRGLKLKVKMFEFVDTVRKLASAPETYQCITDGGLGAKLQPLSGFLYCLEKKSCFI